MNPGYKYVDNNYIRKFYILQSLNNSGLKISWHEIVANLHSIRESLNFWYVLFLLPVIKARDKNILIYISLCILQVITCIAIFVEAVRLRPACLYPIIIMEFAVIDAFLCRVKDFMTRKWPHFSRKLVCFLGVIILLFVVLEFSEKKIRLRQWEFVKTIINTHWPQGHRHEAWQVFTGKMSPYDYLRSVKRDESFFKGRTHLASTDFDYAMLVRQYTSRQDVLLTIPNRFHSWTLRKMTARHGLGSVIYQRNPNDIMSDLKHLDISHLSFIPINYTDYNSYFSPLFHDTVFSKYNKLLLAYRGCALYQFIYAGNNPDYHLPPVNFDGRPFIPMLKK